jgi:hypothetical protein
MLDPTRDPSGIMLVPGLTFKFIFILVLGGVEVFSSPYPFLMIFMILLLWLLSTHFTLYLIVMCSYCMHTSWDVSIHL